jgi:hypothetical protein
VYVAADYSVVDKIVLLRGTPVRGADAATFQHLSGPWSRDQKSVFWSVFRLTKPDPESFVALNPVWGKDRKAAYLSSGKPLVGADASTFRVFDAGVMPTGGPELSHPSQGGFAGDHKRVFFHQCTYPSGWELKKADPATFVSLGHRYARDRTAVFFEQRMVKSADPRSFFVINHFYAADEKSVFYAGRLIKDADPHSFVLLWDWHGMAARDRNTYYDGGSPVPRSAYVERVQSNMSFLKDHEAKVESGWFDDYYRKLMVDYRA